MALKYSTTIQLINILGFKGNIPNWAEGGSDPGNEIVGTGDDVETDFFLDKKNVIDGSYTLYANAVAMTDVTHYALDLDTGAIVLTAAGVTLLSTDDLTAKYSHINVEMTDSYLEEVLARAEKKVDNACNSTFTNTSVDNPAYPLETEIQPSQGIFQDRIITRKKPLIDIVTTLNGALDDSQNTVNLEAGDGPNYPTTGTIIVDSEVMTYTGITTDQLTGVTRGAMGTTAAAHDDSSAVHSTILFLSDTSEGTAVTYTVQPWDSSMDANEFGLIYSFNCQTPTPLVKQGVANRRKILYYYGYDSIPEDITRLTLIFAKEMLVKDSIGTSLIQGRDEFRPMIVDSDRGESERIINSYIVLPMGNT